MKRMEKMARKSVHGSRVQRRRRNQIEKANRRHIRKTLNAEAFRFEVKANGEADFHPCNCGSSHPVP